MAITSFLRNNLYHSDTPASNEIAASVIMPTRIRSLTPWLLMLLSMMILTSCGSSTETIVVDGQARTLETDGEEDEEVDVVAEEDLRVLKIGEANQIRSFDPLFAVNTATKRTIQLLYEGLVRYDENDNIVPAAAASWEVSNDSLTYTFSLRNDLYFHDDESFTHGRGRRVNSGDIKRVFERMASRDAPPDGASLFMNSLEGFEAFYLEQREVYFSEDREISSVSGIRVKSDNIIEFRLLEPDHRFLNKLASPYAVIYPNEPFRFRNDGLHHHAVGTGPFSFEQTIGDSLHILVRNHTYYGKDSQGRQLPRVHRIELLNITDEDSLYSQFSRGRLNMILDLGPLSVQRIVDENDELKDNYNGNHRLEIKPNPDAVILRFNSRNRYELSRADAAAVIRHTDRELLSQNLAIPSLDIIYKEDDYTQTNIGRVFRQFGNVTQNQLIFGYNQDHLSKELSEHIYQLMDSNLQIEVLQRRAFSRDIFLYLDYLTTYYPGEEPGMQPQEILRLTTDRYLLYDDKIEGVLTNSLSWWLNLNMVHSQPVEIGGNISNDDI